MKSLRMNKGDIYCVKTAFNDKYRPNIKQLGRLSASITDLMSVALCNALRNASVLRSSDAFSSTGL